LKSEIIKSDIPEEKGGAEYKYDAFGNLLKDSKAEYSYDLYNRLCEVRKADVTVKYSYDPLGQRIESEESTAKGMKTTKFLMSGMIEQARVTDGVAQFHTSGLDLFGSLTATGGVGAVLASSEYSSSQSPDQQVSKSFNYLYDGNGNVISTCDIKGEFLTKLAYSPFGEKTCGTALAFEFSSKSADSSGLVYYGYRYYNPEIGRWLSRDPIKEKGGNNLFCMSFNNLINYHDYLGLVGVIWDEIDRFKDPVTGADINNINLVGLTGFYEGWKDPQTTSCPPGCYGYKVAKSADSLNTILVQILRLADVRFGPGAKDYAYQHEGKHVNVYKNMVKCVDNAYTKHLGCFGENKANQEATARNTERNACIASANQANSQIDTDDPFWGT